MRIEIKKNNKENNCLLYLAKQRKEVEKKDHRQQSDYHTYHVPHHEKKDTMTFIKT